MGSGFCAWPGGALRNSLGAGGRGASRRAPGTFAACRPASLQSIGSAGSHCCCPSREDRARRRWRWPCASLRLVAVGLMRRHSRQPLGVGQRHSGSERRSSSQRQLCQMPGWALRGIQSALPEAACQPSRCAFCACQSHASVAAHFHSRGWVGVTGAKGTCQHSSGCLYNHVRGRHKQSARNTQVRNQCWTSVLDQSVEGAEGDKGSKRATACRLKNRDNGRPTFQSLFAEPQGPGEENKRGDGKTEI